MIANKVTLSTLQEAAQEVGVSLDTTSLNQKGTRWRVKVNLKVPKECYTKGGRRRTGEGGDAPWQRESVGWQSEGHRVHAVCWHGFRDFFRAVFERTPEAEFRTSLDHWKGSVDFEARYRESGYRNMGSQFAPQAVASACRCPESGYAG